WRGVSNAGSGLATPSDILRAGNPVRIRPNRPPALSFPRPRLLGAPVLAFGRRAGVGLAPAFTRHGNRLRVRPGRQFAVPAGRGGLVGRGLFAALALGP